MRFTKDFCHWCTHFSTVSITNGGFKGLSYSPTIWESSNQTKSNLDLGKYCIDNKHCGPCVRPWILRYGSKTYDRLGKDPQGILCCLSANNAGLFP